ncbi:MAG: helix-turn-helix domain-containing protein [Acidobacteriota bacterium]|nr:helix-turn-helix domain-containing protein [Acidobacteriota bacterium]
MERFCDELRCEREQRNVSIETICAATKVSLRYLQALESGNYDELPGGVFRKGILRSYLRVLELDEDSWMSRFEASLRERGLASEATDWSEFAENVHRNRVANQPQQRTRWFGVAGMFALLALFAWLVWAFVLHKRLDNYRVISASIVQHIAPSSTPSR